MAARADVAAGRLDLAGRRRWRQARLRRDALGTRRGYRRRRGRDARHGQAPLFMLREGEDDLDAELADRGYALVDPVNMYVCLTARLTDIPLPRVTAFVIWEPLAIMEEIWAQGGIGPGRLAVMARARHKTAIFGRCNERPGGVAFAAVHDGACMVHAVEVLPQQRRNGLAAWMMRKAAFWAAEQGAANMAVLCTKGERGRERALFLPRHGCRGTVSLPASGELTWPKLPPHSTCPRSIRSRPRRRSILTSAWTSSAWCRTSCAPTPSISKS